VPSTTPILDLEQDPPEKKSDTWLTAVFMTVCGSVSIAIIVLSATGSPHRLWHLPPLNPLLVWPAFYVAIAVHEIGHLVIGRLAGFRAGSISVGVFTFFHSNRRWAFRFNWHKWFGGFYEPRPEKPGFSRLNTVCMVLGGLIFSALMSASIAGSVFLLGNGAGQWLSTLGYASVFIAALSAMPFRGSDVRHLWDLARNSESARSYMALVQLNADDANGIRPRDWSSELMVDVLADRSINAGFRAYSRCLDEGSDDAALEQLEFLLAQSGRASKRLRLTIFLEASVASAVMRKEAKQARVWLRRACDVGKPESMDATNAAIAMCEGRFSEAAQLWDAVKARVINRKLDSGTIRFALERWSRFSEQCKAASDV
jgi:hypothetical protein